MGLISRVSSRTYKKMDQNDPSAYRLVSLNDEPGTVRIVNKHNVPRGIIINNSGSTDETNSPSNLPSLSEPSGQKVFINNQGNRIYSKTESRMQEQQQTSNNSVSSPNNKSSNSPNAVVNPAGGSSEFKNPRD